MGEEGGGEEVASLRPNGYVFLGCVDHGPLPAWSVQSVGCPIGRGEQRHCNFAPAALNCMLK
jgi:hypothetical protein